MIYQAIPDEVLAKAKDGPHLQELYRQFIDSQFPPSLRTCRRRLQEFNNKGNTVEMDAISAGELHSPDKSRIKADGKCFVLTTAQNNTRINMPFFESLQSYCKYNQAELVVGGITYTRPSGGVVWDSTVQPYICKEPTILAEGLLWCGELNVSPTAVEPFSGLDSYTVGYSGIIPHTKMRMRSLPHDVAGNPRFMYTTGAVTMRNYIPQKAGQKASFHHVYGAVVVEIDNDGDWFVRQLVADSTGGFHDLNKYYSGDCVAESYVKAINWGDVHFPNECADFWYWLDDMSEILRPRYHFLHDVYDFYVRNHHDIKNPHSMFQRKDGKVEEEFAAMEQKLTKVLDKIGGSELVVVHSNHDAALDKWLREADYRADPQNAEFFLWCQHTLYRNGDFKSGKMKSAMPFLIGERGTVCGDKVRYLEPDESFLLFGNTDKPIDCGKHGHNGINGSRGTPSQFTKIGCRANTGHTHTAGILDGVYTAGTSTNLKIHYTVGPSTWSQSHILTYPNSKRAIVSCRGKKWFGGSL